MKIPVLNVNIRSFWPALLIGSVAVVLLLSASSRDCGAKELQQKLFPTPDEAAEALVSAARVDDLEALLAILGPGSRELISSGDSVSDNAERDKFVVSYDQKHSLEAKTVGTMVLHTGNNDWSMPVPIVKNKNGWGFDIGKGKKEILNRRIGRNELQVMNVIDAYVDAQHEYASRDCRGGGRVEFAQHLISTPGNRDGLYWESKEGEQQQSPLGPLIASAAREGYRNGSYLSPFHGYYFKIIKRQGQHANGGSYNYLVKDKMILGFALVAYPAEYRNSGVMTFLVNQEGIIFEKNLGKNTRQLAEAMIEYNPDSSWKKVKVLDKEAQKISPATP